MSDSRRAGVRGDPPRARALRFGIVVVPLQRVHLQQAAFRGAGLPQRHGTDPAQVEVAWVPGAFEIPLLAGKMAAPGRYDAVICLGAVIRGSTPALRLRGRRGGQRGGQGAAGHGRPGDLRRADHGHHRAGGGAGRDEGGEQGLGCGGLRAWRWPTCCAGMEQRRGLERGGRDRAAGRTERGPTAAGEPCAGRVCSSRPARKRGRRRLDDLLDLVGLEALGADVRPGGLAVEDDGAPSARWGSSGAWWPAWSGSGCGRSSGPSRI